MSAEELLGVDDGGHSVADRGGYLSYRAGAHVASGKDTRG
jgi:hypothetical protein